MHTFKLFPPSGRQGVTKFHAHLPPIVLRHGAPTSNNTPQQTTDSMPPTLWDMYDALHFRDIACFAHRMHMQPHHCHSDCACGNLNQLRVISGSTIEFKSFANGIPAICGKILHLGPRPSSTQRCSSAVHPSIPQRKSPAHIAATVWAGTAPAVPRSKQT